LQNLSDKIVQIGFDKFAEITLSQVVFDVSFRKLCEDNVCRQYGTNYMCPPLIGGADECIAKVKKYNGGMVVQSIVKLEDSFDFEGMMAGQKEHDNRLRILAEFLRNDGGQYLVLGAGPCPQCAECCAIKKKLCINPDKAISSVEAHCIDVTKTVTNAGLKYNNGEATVSYVGLVLTK